jgi:hypothetical protein
MKRQECRAAKALHFCRQECLDVASIDADLQRVLDAWSRLSEAIRKVILVLVGLPLDGAMG